MGHHHHHHHHHHDQAAAGTGRAFAVGIALNAGYTALEATAGAIAGSLALMADAAHNLSDVLGLVLAWGATLLARRAPTPRRTYGMQRSSILAALLNAALLLVAVGAIGWEAMRRFLTPVAPPGLTLAAVALIGVAINAGTALLFLRDRHRDLNVRGAYLHMVADAAVSLGVVVAGLIIHFTGWLLVDPLISLVVAGLIAVGTWGLMREALDLALDAVPRRIDPEAVAACLAGLDGVRDVHHLHIWGLSTIEVALTAHLVVDPEADDGAIALATAELHRRFGIDHVTIQLERGGAGACAGQVGCAGGASPCA